MQSLLVAYSNQLGDTPGSTSIWEESTTSSPTRHEVPDSQPDFFVLLVTALPDRDRVHTRLGDASFFSASRLNMSHRWMR